MNLACKLFFLLAALAAFHVLGEPNTLMWRAKYMNVARQIHESGVPIILFFT